VLLSGTCHSAVKDVGKPLTALVPAVVPKEFEGLELGPLLGKGSYGRVYRGVYHGEEVAVKVGSSETLLASCAGCSSRQPALDRCPDSLMWQLKLCAASARLPCLYRHATGCQCTLTVLQIMDSERVEMNEQGEPLEAVLTGAKPHPALVTTIAWCALPGVVLNSWADSVAQDIEAEGSQHVTTHRDDGRSMQLTCLACAHFSRLLVPVLCRTVTSPPLPYPGEDADAEAERLEKLPPGGSQTWLLLEFCDKPCLQVTPGCSGTNFPEDVPLCTHLLGMQLHINPTQLFWL
jgi:hypothetical protein